MPPTIPIPKPGGPRARARRVHPRTRRRLRRVPWEHFFGRLYVNNGSSSISQNHPGAPLFTLRAAERRLGAQFFRTRWRPHEVGRIQVAQIMVLNPGQTNKNLCSNTSRGKSKERLDRMCRQVSQEPVPRAVHQTHLESSQLCADNGATNTSPSWR